MWLLSLLTYKYMSILPSYSPSFGAGPLNCVLRGSKAMFPTRCGEDKLEWYAYKIILGHDGQSLINNNLCTKMHRNI